MADINAYYQDLLKGEDARWAAQQNTLAGQANIFQRQADLGSARMGRGAGGGLLQAKGAALGAGMREFDKGFQEYDKNKRQLGLAWLDKQIEERRRGEDKDFAREQGDKADEMQLMQMYLEYGAGVPFDEFKAAVEGGDMAGLGGPTKTSGVEGFDDDKDGRQDAYTINTPNGPVSIDSTQQKDVQNAVERRFGSKWTGVEGAPTFVMQWIANNASQMFDGGIPGPNSPIWDALEAAMRDKGYPIEGPQAGWYTID